MQNGERKDVYKIYDQIARWFAQNRDTILIEKKYLDEVIALLPVDASILDLGCGTGQPILRYLLSKNINVTGVDASVEILDIAKVNFPTTEFIQADMRQLDLGRTFDAIIAWHSFFHLPPDDQPAMFGIFKRHLKAGGILLFTSGTQHGEAWGFLGGHHLCHGSLTTAEYEQLLTDNGLRVLKHTVDDPQCGGATVWLAKLG